jgi:exopolysaccharide biosynthesis protein
MWWLITIDGRQPGRAIGMSFGELQALLARLGAIDALNLDGGGSTTMVVGGEVVNRPSDPTGPRPVSDAIIVIPR